MYWLYGQPVTTKAIAARKNGSHFDDGCFPLIRIPIFFIIALLPSDDATLTLSLFSGKPRDVRAGGRIRRDKLAIGYKAFADAKSVSQ